MHVELAPLHRAQELIQCGTSGAEVIDELQILFGLDFVAAAAMASATALLMEHGVTIPEEQFVRPYLAKHADPTMSGMTGLGTTEQCSNPPS